MPGAAPFPVRLAGEVFERCRAVLVDKGINGPYTVYDPFCGGGYTLTVLGFQFMVRIKGIVASDADSRMVSLASRNLGLLSATGLNNRIMQIEQLIGKYEKESHKEALESALRLKSISEARKLALELDCFSANAAQLGRYKDRLTGVDMVITDLPYGRITSWSDIPGVEDPASEFLESLQEVIPPHSVVAVISDKKQKVAHAAYRRVERFNAGKRLVTILERERKL